jgi:hypothetical protein
MLEIRRYWWKCSDEKCRIEFCAARALGYVASEIITLAAFHEVLVAIHLPKKSPFASAKQRGWIRSHPVTVARQGLFIMQGFEEVKDGRCMAVLSNLTCTPQTIKPGQVMACFQPDGESFLLSQ